MVSHLLTSESDASDMLPPRNACCRHEDAQVRKPSLCVVVGHSLKDNKTNRKVAKDTSLSTSTKMHPEKGKTNHCDYTYYYSKYITKHSTTLYPFSRFYIENEEIIWSIVCSLDIMTWPQNDGTHTPFPNLLGNVCLWLCNLKSMKSPLLQHIPLPSTITSNLCSTKPSNAQHSKIIFQETLQQLIWQRCHVAQHCFWRCQLQQLPGSSGGDGGHCMVQVIVDVIANVPGIIFWWQNARQLKAGWSR